MTPTHRKPYDAIVEVLLLADVAPGRHRAPSPSVEHFDGRPCVDPRIITPPGGPSVCWAHDRRVFPLGTRARTAATRRH